MSETAAPTQAAILAEHAAEIRRLGKRVVADVIEILREILDASGAPWRLETGRRHFKLLKLPGDLGKNGPLPAQVRDRNEITRDLASMEEGGVRDEDEAA